jgi:hypothetical protein
VYTKMNILSLTLIILYIGSSLLLLNEVLIYQWLLFSGVLLCIILSLSWYTLYRLQPYSYMVAGSIFLSAYLSRWIYDLVDLVEKNLVIQPIIMLRFSYFLFLISGLYLVFVYFRVIASFQKKRGNVEKEHVVRYVEPFWERMRKVFQKMFQRKREEPVQDIYFPIGAIPDERKER